MTYTYNENGIRTSKTANGVKHTYTLNGTQIVSEAWGNELLMFVYDESGSPIRISMLTVIIILSCAEMTAGRFGITSLAVSLVLLLVELS